MSTTTPLSCHRSTALVDCIRGRRGSTLATSFRCIVVNSVLRDDDLQTWSCDHLCCKDFYSYDLNDVTLDTMLVM